VDKVLNPAIVVFAASLQLRELSHNNKCDCRRLSQLYLSNAAVENKELAVPLISANWQSGDQ
jgi:hypothetical protein